MEGLGLEVKGPYQGGWGVAIWGPDSYILYTYNVYQRTYMYVYIYTPIQIVMTIIVIVIIVIVIIICTYIKICLYKFYIYIYIHHYVTMHSFVAAKRTAQLPFTKGFLDFGPTNSSPPSPPHHAQYVGLS